MTKLFDKMSAPFELMSMPGSKLFVTLNDVIYKSEQMGDVTIKSGLLTDLATVPWYLRWLVSTSGKHKDAAILHDGVLNDPRYSRLQADNVFKEALGDSGVSGFRKNLMYAGVRINAILKGEE